MTPRVTMHANFSKSLEHFWPGHKVGAGIGSAFAGCFGLSNGRDEGVQCIQLVRSDDIRDHARTHDWPTSDDQSARLHRHHTKDSCRGKVPKYSNLAAL